MRFATIHHIRYTFGKEFQHHPQGRHRIHPIILKRVYLAGACWPVDPTKMLEVYFQMTY